MIDSFAEGRAPFNQRLRLLVAAEFPPNASGGGPVVIRQMLREWPVEDLVWWSCLPERDARFGQRVHQSFCARIPPKFMPQRRYTRLRSAVLEWLWKPWASAHFLRTVRRSAPDVIWVIPHNWAIPPLAVALKSCPVRFHVTVQDYVDVHGQTERFGMARCRRMASLTDRIYADATTRDATSHPMIADLHERTGYSASQMLHAGLEKDDFKYLQAKGPRLHATIRIAYAGTILVPQEFSLFVAAVRQVRQLSPIPISLELFGAHSYTTAPWFDPAWMREHGNLAEPELSDELRACTWGFAPMSLTDHDPRYNRFSFPTKFITYLAAGIPVITMGHPESSVMQMATQYQVGLATSSDTVDALARQLSECFASGDPWVRHSKEIVRCASVEFDASRSRAKLRECFHECAEATRIGSHGRA